MRTTSLLLCLLPVLTAPAFAAPLSIRCIDSSQPFHTTFDAKAGWVVFEGLGWPQQTRKFLGRVNQVDGEKAALEVKVEGRRVAMVFDQKAIELTLLGEPGNSTYLLTVYRYELVALRNKAAEVARMWTPEGYSELSPAD